jgi:hypothetical protein
MRALLLTVIVLAPALVAPRAQAQPTPSSDASSKADRVFCEGRMAANAGDYTTARARFLESERLEPAPGTLLNVADCEVHLGLLVAAREHFELAASGFPRGDSRRTWAATQASQIEKRLAHLTLRLDPQAPVGTAITMGGSAVDPSAMGHPALADPGAVQIVVTAPGRVARTLTLTLAEGQSLDEVLTVGDPLPATEAPPAAAPPSTEPATPAMVRSYPLRPVGYVVAGVGVAGLVAGSVAGILALDKASTMKSHCNTSTWVCDSQGVDAAQSGGTLATVSNISLVAGAVLGGVGAYLVFLYSSMEAPAATSLVPYADPHGAGAAFTSSF